MIYHRYIFVYNWLNSGKLSPMEDFYTGPSNFVTRFQSFEMLPCDVRWTFPGISKDRTTFIICVQKHVPSTETYSKSSHSSETSVIIYQTTWLNILSDLYLQLHSCENLKSRWEFPDLLYYMYLSRVNDDRSEPNQIVWHPPFVVNTEKRTLFWQLMYTRYSTHFTSDNKLNAIS